MNEPQVQVRTGTGSEGAHWYIPGHPVVCAYEILGANGKWRSTTMRDARKYDWFPGVTTITRLVASPGLERWKVRQGIMSALTHPKAHEVTDADELIRMIEQDSKEQGRQAAADGTAIHKAVEMFFLTGNVEQGFELHIQGVRDELAKLVGEDAPWEWKTEVAAVHKFGVGTRIDLLSEKFNMVVDFKSKEFGEGDEVKGYPTQCEQLAACREMVLPKARTVNLFISRTDPGLVKSFEWTDEQSQTAWDRFQCLLRYWQISNNFPVRC